MLEMNGQIYTAAVLNATHVMAIPEASEPAPSAVSEQPHMMTRPKRVRRAPKRYGVQKMGGQLSPELSGLGGMKDNQINSMY